MGRYTTNQEGLTFEEWVAAAGALTTDGVRRVLPWTSPGGYAWRPYPKWVRTSWREGVDPTDVRPYMDHELAKVEAKKKEREDFNRGLEAMWRLVGVDPEVEKRLRQKEQQARREALNAKVRVRRRRAKRMAEAAP